MDLPAARMSAPLLELRSIVKCFGDHRVLDGLDLVVERGETVVVIGGSGSGKSTLARLVVGLDEPTAGKIFVDGSDLGTLGDHALARERARFAMVFQKYALLDSLTVYDNVAFPLRERHTMREPEIHALVMAQLRALDVAHAAWLLPEELSGGMAKRVGIARAMVMGPEFLVYDEPTSGLDPITSRRVDDLIEEVRAHFLVTSIVITHDMATAFRIADRVVLLDRGKIAIDATPERLFATSDPRVRPFADSSGVDPSRLAVRLQRKTPAEIRALWEKRPAPPPRTEAHHAIADLVRGFAIGRALRRAE